VKSIVITIVLAAAALAAGAAAASAKTNECSGLQTCVPIAGPWVVVPLAGGAARPSAEYQLSCPAGFIAGGIDVGAGAAVASFRPHLGCIPASGGGARVPTVVHVYPVGKPVVRRSRDTRLRPGRQQAISVHCAARESPVASWDAVGFYTTAPPTPRLARAVARGTRTVRSGRVQVVTRTGDIVRGVRAVAQVGAVCAVGT